MVFESRDVNHVGGFKSVRLHRSAPRNGKAALASQDHAMTVPGALPFGIVSVGSLPLEGRARVARNRAYLRTDLCVWVGTSVLLMTMHDFQWLQDSVEDPLVIVP
jgi:hypothetical protein